MKNKYRKLDLDNSQFNNSFKKLISNNNSPLKNRLLQQDWAPNSKLTKTKLKYEMLVSSIFKLELGKRVKHPRKIRRVESRREQLSKKQPRWPLRLSLQLCRNLKDLLKILEREPPQIWLDQRINRKSCPRSSLKTLRN